MNTLEDIDDIENVPLIDNAEIQSADIDTDACSICLESMNDVNTRTTDCNHTFHSSCLDTWLVEHNTCPSCRHELFPENELPVLEGRSVEGYLCSFGNQRRIWCCYFPASIRRCIYVVYMAMAMIFTFALAQIYENMRDNPDNIKGTDIVAAVICSISIIVNLGLMIMLKCNIQVNNFRPQIIPEDELPV